jgi:hypothetical protein
MTTIQELGTKLRGQAAWIVHLGRYGRERRLLDAGSRPAGTVQRVLRDAGHRILLMEVTVRGRVGLRKARLLVPGEFVTDVTDRAIQVNLSREQLRGAPALPEALAGRGLDEVYSYFGCSRPAGLRVYPGSGHFR